MKLAEALILRADLQKRLAQLRQRLAANARVQEGEQPAEDPTVLLSELDTMSAELETLLYRINITNGIVSDDGVCMTALLAKRDVLRLRIETLREFVQTAAATVMRGTRTEVIIRSTVSVAEQQKKLDALSKELRDLEMRIQSLNWTSDLI